MDTKIILVDLAADNRFDELMEALSQPGARIISSVAADQKIVYVVESRLQ